VPSTASTVAYLPPEATSTFNLMFVHAEREGGADAQTEQSGPAWTVRFSFESPDLGPLHAAIRLSSGNIGVKIWAERPDVATALEQDSAELRLTLQEAALNVEAVAIFAGRPPDQTSRAGGSHSAIT
jgi:Flagellar hook-length control protein FliK